MDELLARNLQGKVVVGLDGEAFGRLYNLTMDVDSGDLHDLVVEPEESDDRTRVDGDRERLRIPVSRIETISDRIVVEADRPDERRDEPTRARL